MTRRRRLPKGRGPDSTDRFQGGAYSAADLKTPADRHEAQHATVASESPDSSSSSKDGHDKENDGQISHDQAFKNLILDYPREALLFYAEAEAKKIDPSARITPIRQEQLKDRLGDRFFELDVPLLVEWPDGDREAIVFILEEETDPRRFSIHRLGAYCLSVSELMKTERVVPVVIFLKAGPKPRESLVLGSREREYVSIEYIGCNLPEMQATRYYESTNIVARLNLVAMRHQPEDRPTVYGQALKGLLALESNTDKQRKYLDFIDMYLPLSDNEREAFERNYRTESRDMGGIVSRAIKQGMEEGIQQGLQAGRFEGRQEGMQEMLIRQLQRRFGPLDAGVEARLKAATASELAKWIDNFVDARSLEEVFEAH